MMNKNKSKELAVENGALKIRVRALEDRVAIAERNLIEQKGYVAIALLAFKRYIKSTTPVTAQPPTDAEIVSQINELIDATIKDVDASLKSKETKPNDKRAIV